MKSSYLEKWCGQPWLHCIYLLGIIMSNVLIIFWNVWDTPQKLMCALTIMIPLHVFEENTFPGGFFYMNNLGQKSESPLVYPQNKLTNMITNLGAETLFILMTFFTKRFEAVSVVIVILFGIGEVIHHTRDGISMYRRYKNKGKKTLYGPGTITSYIGLLQLSVIGCCWMAYNAFAAVQVIIGVAVVIGIVVCLILVPFAFSRKIKSQKYAFKDNGYFSKFK